MSTPEPANTSSAAAVLRPHAEHEFAHELLHRSADRPPSRDTRELEAEAVAFVVGDAVGLDVSQSSRDYIQLYRGDRDALVASLDRIRHAAATILGAVGTAT